MEEEQQEYLKDSFQEIKAGRQPLKSSPVTSGSSSSPKISIVFCFLPCVADQWSLCLIKTFCEEKCEIQWLIAVSKAGDQCRVYSLFTNCVIAKIALSNMNSIIMLDNQLPCNDTALKMTQKIRSAGLKSLMRFPRGFYEMGAANHKTLFWGLER